VGSADRHRSMHDVSQGCLALTGYTNTEIIEQQPSYGSLIALIDRTVTLAAIHQAIAQKQPYGVEYRIHTRDGQEKWVWEKGHGVFNASGTLMRIEGFISDSTERKQTEAELRQQEKFLQLVLDHVPQYIFWKDTRSVYLGCNRSWAEAAGLSSAQEVRGKSDSDFFLHAGKAEIYRTQDCYILATGQPYRAVEEWILPDGNQLWIDVHKIPIPDHNGKIVGILGAIEDITESRRTEAQLQHQATRDRLLKDIALQIQQSLNLKDILETTVAQMQRFLQVDRVLVYQLDHERAGSLVAAATAPDWSVQSSSDTRGIDAAADPHQTWKWFSSPTMATCYSSILDVAYEQGKVRVVHDVNEHDLSPEFLAFLHQLQVKAKIVVPLLHGDELWGLLTVHQCTQSRRWQPFEIDFLQQLATQVAIALQQAQLFNRVQQQAQREQLLNHISRSISASFDPDHILEEIVKLTGEYFQVDRVLIYAINQQIRAINEWRQTEQVPSLLGFSWRREDWTDLLDPDADFLNHRAFHAPRFTELPMTPGRAIEQQGQTRSLLNAPIVIRGELFGGLAVNTTTGYRTFTAEEIHLLEQIADQAAIALYNAQSYERLEQQVKARTQELEAEKRLSETANRAKSEFLAVMSHELRTPLNAVMGLSELLRQEIFGELNAKQREYIACIHSSGQHLLELISDILDLSKVEAGKEELVLAPVDVAELCASCLALMHEKAITAGLTLSQSIDPLAHTCVADERRLRQMLLNLLSNAVKFTPAGEVSLIVEKQLLGVCFSVVDTGIGIAPEQLLTLFQPFHQLDSQLNRRYEGTGLGLALTQRLAQLHEGHVSVESVLGQGSRFTIYLPDRTFDPSCVIPAVAPHPPTAADRLGTPPRPKRVLIVEDDRTSALLIQDYLQVLGYQVKLLFDGIDFLERLRQFQPDLVLMDVQLTDEVTGLDLLVAVRQQPDLQHLPVVMVTAMAMRGDSDRLLAAGATDYLSKPIGLMQLESALLRCL